MTDRVVAVLGRGVVPADAPILRADDLGVLRGDGVFETLHVRGGRPWLLDDHLDRMARSAARLDLSLPDRESLVGLADTACAAWPAAQEGALRLICTRGVEPPPGITPASTASTASPAGAGGHGPGAGAAAGPGTVFATLSPIGDAVRAARRDGIAVATATVGFTAAVRQDAPWLLGGVKSLSYAMNMASQRWAYAHGVDDVLWVSADGYALEAPTSTLVWLAGETLCTVPAAQTGILPGTTAGWLLDRADALGWRAAERMVRPAELATADGVWFTSSVRGPVPLRELDGKPLPVSPHRAAVRNLLGYPLV